MRRSMLNSFKTMLLVLRCKEVNMGRVSADLGGKKFTGKGDCGSYANAVAWVALAPLMLFVSCLHGQASFSFQTYALNNLPFQVVTGDFNEDGKPDIAVLSATGGTVSVLLMGPGGTFSPARDFPAIKPQAKGFCCGGFNGIAVGDVNGDGKLDLVIADPANPRGSSVNVLLGSGDGTFGPPIITSLNSIQAGSWIGVADFNGDKKLDVALYGFDGNVSGPLALLGNGDGTFTPGSISTTGGDSPSLITDINNDGKVDIVGSSGSALYVFLGTGDATFQPPSQIPVQTTWIARMVAGDFNRDGNIDFVSTSYQEQECEFFVCHPKGPAGALAVLMGSGNSSFGGPGVLTSGDFGPAAVGDFDGDSNLDIAVIGPAGASSPSSIYFGDGQGAFPKQLGIGFAGDVVYPSMVSADFNGDGLSDIAFVAFSSPSLEVALNTTPGFKLRAPSAGQSVGPGGSATYTISVDQQNGFDGSVSLTCSVQGLQGIACSVSPMSVSPGNTFTLNVTTTGTSSALVRAEGRYTWLSALWLPFAAVMQSCWFGRKSTWRRNPCSLTLLCLIGLGACGGGNNSTQVHRIPSSTSQGNYTIIVTGTSGSLQRSAEVTLTVQ